MPDAPLRESLLRLLRAPDSRPMTKSELSRALDIPSDRRGPLRKTLQELEADGTLVQRKRGRYAIRESNRNELRGSVKFNPKGQAWFFPDRGDPQNLAGGFDMERYSRIHVARHATGTALDGDRVLVSIHHPKPKPHLYRRARKLGVDLDESEPRARVEKVLDRRSGRLVGRYQKKGDRDWVEPEDFAVNESIDLLGETTARPGQVVVVQVEDWQRGNPRGRIIEVLGWPGDSGVDILSIIHRNGIRTSFPEEVLAAARAVPEQVDAKEAKRREDWRDKLVITIDPADAKDHDDAIWVRRHPKGWTLAVHIADVSHYVKPGGPLDVEAEQRGNSTYLVDRVVPMLPVELSNGICSLVPDVDRLTKCAVLEVTPQGKVSEARFCDAIIHSRAKLSYEQAQAILDGGEAPEGSDKDLATMVREAWKVAATLRRRRFNAGALDLEMPEVKVMLDDDGKPQALETVEYNESHQLIEECMLAANEAVARLLKQRNKPAIYRIHEDPDFGRLQEFAETAQAYGYQPGDLSNKDHVQKLLDAARGRPDEHAIKIGLLKSLKRAIYSNEPLGHYGLSKADYCHFTSPIRRYADLVVHRALQNFLSNKPSKPDRTPGHGALAEIARHISTTERASADAENASRDLKMLEYLEICAKSDPPVLFEGLITDVRSAGLMVEATGISVRGMIRRADLPGGPWRIERTQARFTGPGGQSYQMGQRLRMEVARIDRERRFIDFAPVDKAPRAEKPAKGSRRPARSGNKNSGNKRSAKKQPSKKQASNKQPAKKEGSSRSSSRRRRRNQAKRS